MTGRVSRLPASIDGRTFLYLTDMYSDHLKIYRFDAKRDGEIGDSFGVLRRTRAWC